MSPQPEDEKKRNKELRAKYRASVPGVVFVNSNGKEIADQAGYYSDDADKGPERWIQIVERYLEQGPK